MCVVIERYVIDLTQKSPANLDGSKILALAEEPAGRLTVGRHQTRSIAGSKMERTNQKTRADLPPQISRNQEVHVEA